MIRKVINSILERFDSAVMDATVRFRLREQNLERFGELVYQDIKSMLGEVAATDSRITFEERNRGFYVHFKGFVLFRVAVNVFTERAEVLVDRQTIVKYMGLSDSYLTNYGPDSKISASIKSAILAAFSNNMREFLIKELNKL
jgi:hypothetical protein